MSFRDLKELFDQERENLDALDPFRRLYLRTLFEMNGNVDTLALSSRAVVELLDKQNSLLTALAEQNAAIQEQNAVLAKIATAISMTSGLASRSLIEDIPNAATNKRATATKRGR